MERKHNPKNTSAARMLRKNMTKEEHRLWYEYLRDYPIRFYRQKVLGNYIVDFYCAKAKLVIELDGSQHYDEAQMRYDQQRTADLERFDLLVIRIPNNEVNDNLSGVCEHIDRAVKMRMRALSMGK